MPKKWDPERLERIRKLVLSGIFVCAVLLCLSFLVGIGYSWHHTGQAFPHERVFMAGGLILIAVIAAMGLASHLFLARRAASGLPGSGARNDERAAFLWLKAYRVAFFVLLAIQVMSKVPIMIGGWPWDVPYQSALTLSAALAVSTGAFLMYSRKLRHD